MGLSGEEQGSRKARDAVGLGVREVKHVPLHLHGQVHGFCGGI